MNRRAIYSAAIVGAVAAFGASPGTAAATELPTITNVTGSVSIIDAQGGRTGAFAGLEVPPGAVLETGKGAEADIVLGDGSEVKVGESTRIRLAAKRPGSIKQAVNLFFGSLWANVVKAAGTSSETKFEVRTANAVAGVRGTQIVIACGHGQFLLQVPEGNAVVESLLTRATTDVGGGYEMKMGVDGQPAPVQTITTNPAAFIAAAADYVRANPQAAARLLATQKAIQTALKAEADSVKAEMETTTDPARLAELQDKAATIHEASEAVTEGARQVAAEVSDILGTWVANGTITQEQADQIEADAEAVADQQKAVDQTAGEAYTEAQEKKAEGALQAAAADGELTMGEAAELERITQEPAWADLVQEPTEGNITDPIVVQQEGETFEQAAEAAGVDSAADPNLDSPTAEDLAVDVDIIVTCASPNGGAECTTP